MKKVIIHFGIHKTASSSIQSSLMQNRLLLEKQGWHYPLFFNRNNSLLSNHSQVLCSLFYDSPERYYLNILDGYVNSDLIKDIKSYKKQLSDTLLRKENIILSAEDLCGFSVGGWIRLIEFVKDICPESKINLIGFSREHEDYVLNAIQERMKGGVAALDHEKNRLIAIITNLNKDRFEKVMDLDVDNVNIFSFEEACLDANGPVGFFLRNIGLDISLNKSFLFARENDDLPMEGVLFLDKLNKKYPSIVGHKKNNDRPNVSLSGLEGKKFFLDKSSVDEIRLASDNDKVWLYKKTGIDYRLTKKKTCNVYDVSLWSKLTLSEMIVRVKSDLILINLFLELLEEQKNLHETTDPAGLERINKAIYELKFLSKQRNNYGFRWIDNDYFKFLVDWRPFSASKKDGNLIYSSLHGKYDVLIHIGAPKTGTSAIQKFLLENRVRLKDYGFYYPEHGLDRNGISGGHSCIGSKLISGEIDAAKEVFNKHLIEAKKKNLLLVLSAESFFRRPAELRLIVGSNAVNIISFIRDPLSSMFSLYNQNVKRHFQTDNVNDFCRKRVSGRNSNDLLGPFLEEWRANFSKENVVILRYDKVAFIDRTIQEVFLESIGVSKIEVDKIKPGGIDIVNKSYNLGELEFKRIINHVLNKNNYYHNNEIDFFLQHQSDKSKESLDIIGQISSGVMSKILEKFDLDGTVSPVTKCAATKKLKKILDIIDLLRETKIETYSYIEQCIGIYLDDHPYIPVDVYNLATWFDIDVDFSRVKK